MAGYTFANSAVETVKFFGSVTDLGYNGFRSCAQLEKFVVPDSVTEIANECFADCTALHTVVLPEGLVEIGENAFDGCTALTSIDLNPTITVNFNYTGE